MRASFMVTFAGVGSLGAAAWLGTQAAVTWAVVLAVIGATALLVSASMVGVVSFAGFPRPDRGRMRQAGTLVVVTLVVTTAAIGGMAGPLSVTEPAKAQTAGDLVQCGTAAVQTAVYTMSGASKSVVDSMGSLDDSCDWTTDQENVTHAVAMQGVVSDGEQAKSFADAQNNLLEASEDTAWGIAYVTAVQEMNNGSSKAEVKAAAKADVDDYYARIQNNTIDSYVQTAYSIDAATDVDGVQIEADEGFNSPGHPLYTDRTTVTLVNGDSRTFDALDSIEPDFNDGGLSQTVYMKSPDGTVRAVANFNRHKVVYQNAEDKATNTRAEIDNFVENAYENYTAGEINNTDLAQAAPTAVATDAATAGNSTGYYGYSNTALSAMGLAGQDNASHQLQTDRNVTKVNETTGEKTTVQKSVNISGTLYYTGDDVDEWVTGQTYDPDNLTGVVYVTVSEMEQNGSLVGTGSFFEVTEPFTIKETTDVRTGESLNSTRMDQRNFTDVDPSDLNETLQEFKDLREYYEEQAAAASGGGGSDRTTLILLGAAALLGAGAMSRRDN